MNDNDRSYDIEKFMKKMFHCKKCFFTSVIGKLTWHQIKKLSDDRCPKCGAEKTRGEVMSKHVVVVMVCILYFAGMWATFGYTLSILQKCERAYPVVTLSNKFDVWIKCGGHAEVFFETLFWPAYWFLKSSTIAFGVE